MGEGEGDAGGELGRHDGRRLRLRLKLWTARGSSQHSTAQHSKHQRSPGERKTDIQFNSIQLQPGEREVDIQKGS